MSEVTRRELFPGVWLRTVHTRKFKSAFLSLTLMVPLDRERAAENALVPYVLRRGTREHPDLEDKTGLIKRFHAMHKQLEEIEQAATDILGRSARYDDPQLEALARKILDTARQLEKE